MDRKTLLGAVTILVVTISGSGVANAQTIEYVHTDALGSVVAISDSVGQVNERREYEPFGSQLTPSVQDGPGYTGHVQDASTGLTYMQQRYYDPMIGLFISVDPVEIIDSEDVRYFNRYSYGFKNPYTFTDPDGRCPNCTLNPSSIGSFTSSAKIQSAQRQANSSARTQAAAMARGFKSNIDRGNGTVQVGISATVSAGLKVNVEAGLAVDRQGSIGTYGDAGAGIASGADANLSLSGRVTDAASIKDLQGGSIVVGAEGGVGAHAGVDVSRGFARDGSTVTGIGVSGGGGTGASGSVNGSYTSVAPIIDRESKK